MKRFASLSSQDNRLKSTLQAVLFHSRKDNRDLRKKRLGPQLISNIDFNPVTGWSVTGESTLAPGEARLISSAGAASSIDRAGLTGLSLDKFYHITIVVSEYVSGSLELDGVFGNNILIGAANGTFNRKLKPVAASGTLSLSNIANITNLRIQSVSVRRIG
jgi:hypothetical protein